MTEWAQTRFGQAEYKVDDNKTPDERNREIRRPGGGGKPDEVYRYIVCAQTMLQNTEVSVTVQVVAEMSQIVNICEPLSWPFSEIRLVFFLRIRR